CHVNSSTPYFFNRVFKIFEFFYNTFILSICRIYKIIQVVGVFAFEFQTKRQNLFLNRCIYLDQFQIILQVNLPLVLKQYLRLYILYMLEIVTVEFLMFLKLQ